MEWVSVEKYLPGEQSDWVIVRCVNKDLCGEFYFMANYSCGGWDFFDDDKGYGEEMRITHWAYADKVAEPDYFIKKDGTVITE